MNMDRQFDRSVDSRDLPPTETDRIWYEVDQLQCAARQPPLVAPQRP
jgi:hypothetical protein